MSRHSTDSLSARRAAELLEGSARVLVVGDCMLDHYMTGRVNRISPEAPVPVVRVEDEWKALGGAANVAAGIVALGASCRVVGAVGDDEAGGEARALLEEAGIDASDLVTDESRPTTVKSRVLARHQQMLRIDRESDGPLHAPAREAILDAALEGLPWADVVALVDYDKGVLSDGVGREIAREADDRGVPSVVDPKLRSFFDFPRAFLVKPNDDELAAALGAERSPRDEASLEEVRRRLECRHLLITLGEEGMVLVSEEEGGMRRIPSEAREVFDVSGAGDTVTAVLAVALCSGSGAHDAAGVADAAALANHAAGIEVSHLGAVPVGRSELLDALGDTQG